MKRVIVLLTLACILGSAAPAYGDELLEDIGEALGELAQGIIWGAFDLQMVIRIRLAIDYASPNTRPFLLSLVDPRHEGPYNIAQVCDIWDYCYEHWVYISDPYAAPFDSFASASETIAAGLRGDCDDFAVLLAAAVRAIGGTALVQAEFAEGLGHAYTLVYIGSETEVVALNLLYIMARYGLTLDDLGSTLAPVVYPDWGVWLSLDWFADHPGGPLWVGREKLTDSHYLPTPSKLGLLLEPIMIAPEASLEMITREFSPEVLQTVLSDK